MLKLSIIVPIYNVEPYLRKCVDSLLSQDLPQDEYEIILVDDGSTDGSGMLADELAQSPITNHKSQIIKVLHQPNGGLSAARNSGLRMAQGKYVQFVDSDDYLEPNVLGGLVAQMEREDLDVLRFDYQNVRIVRESESESESERYEVFEPNKTPRNIDKRTDVVDGITYLNERMGYACYAWQFMVKRSLLVSDQQSVVSSPESPITNHKSPIFFTEGIHFEDVDWTPRMLLTAQRVNSTQTIVYNYLHRMGSITKTTNAKKKIKNINDQMFVIGRLQCEIDNDSYNREWHERMISKMTLSTLSNIIDYQYVDRNAYYTSLKQLRIFPLCTKKISVRDKIWVHIANVSLLLYTIAYRMRCAMIKIHK